MKEGLEKFAIRLKDLRVKKNIKQVEMGKFLGCSMRNYQRIEYGESDIPATKLMKLADYFGVTTDYLLGRSEDGGPEREE